ncbi:glycosyltransferase family 2 protein (plasmid) [Streptomycetaceae bacterium NBC_01309]
MPVLSLVTPVHAAAIGFLPDAYGSLLIQQLPEDWTWEWRVHEDGPHVGAADVLPVDHDRRIRISSSRVGGPHVSRTMAFAHSIGVLVKTFDADDRLTEGALARDILALRNPAVGWATSAALDLMPDGSLEAPPEVDPPPGLLPRGSLYDFWSRNHYPRVHPATLCVRRELLALKGGWMALPASGDTGLLLGLSALSDGWFTAECGLHYRRHPGQTTAHPHHNRGPDWKARMSLIMEHTQALAVSGTRQGPVGRHPNGGAGFAAAAGGHDRSSSEAVPAPRR